MNMNTDSIKSNDIITYKFESGFVYGYLNQKALDLALYYRAKKRTHNFEDKNQWEVERDKRAVRLDDISIQRHSILFRPVSEGEYISDGDVIFDIGLNSLYSGSYFRENNISEVDTLLCCGIKVFSSYSGYYSCKIEDEIIGSCNMGNTIKDGDLLFTIKQTSKPLEIDSHIKNVDFKYDMLPREFLEGIPYLSDVAVSKWLVGNYTEVKKGDKLLEVTEFTHLKPNFITIIKSPYSGLLVKRFHSEGSSFLKLRKGTSLFTIYSDESKLRESYPYRFNVTKDDFTKQTIVKCEMTRQFGLISSFGFYMGDTHIYINHGDYDKSPIYFNFENVSGKYFMIMSFNMKAIKIDKLSSLHLLLDNGNVITLSLIANPIKSSSDYICKFPLSSADMDELESAKFTKWRITNGEGVNIKESNNVCCHDDEDKTTITQNLSYDVFQSFVKDFKKCVDNNISKEELEKSDESDTLQKECYVYLMVDTTNNFHKIGISNNPKYREHTLQSDKPTIELVCFKVYPTRIIAEAIESSLHRVYAKKRIRGEWFNLDSSDIDVIKQTLK